MEQTIQWHYISEEGMPNVKGEKPRCFLVCQRCELAETFEVNGRKEKVPSGKYIEVCTLALLQNHESQDGWAYTPKNKFYWGPDIFNNVYAWAEFPNQIPFK